MHLVCNLSSLHLLSLSLTSLLPTQLAVFWIVFLATHSSSLRELLVSRHDHSNCLPHGPPMLWRGLSAMDRHHSTHLPSLPPIPLPPILLPPTPRSPNLLMLWGEPSPLDRHHSKPLLQ